MQQIKKTNLILFVLIVLIAAASYFISQNKQDKESIFLPIAINNIQHILIQQTPPLEFRKSNGIWEMLQPQTGQINANVMQSILDSIASAVYDEYRVDEVTLKELSLEPPNLRVLIDGEALEFGALSPITQKHYVRYMDNVYLASPFLLIRFSNKADAFLKPEKVDIR
jgi:hypothetical protein